MKAFVFVKHKKFLVIVKQQFDAKLCVFVKHMKLSIFIKHMKICVIVKREHYANFVSCHVVTLGLFHIVIIWTCCIWSCKFWIITKSYAFRILTKSMGFVLLYFKLSVSHCCILNLELFYCCFLFSTCVRQQLQNFQN